MENMLVVILNVKEIKIRKLNWTVNSKVPNFTLQQKKMLQTCYDDLLLDENKILKKIICVVRR